MIGNYSPHIEEMFLSRRNIELAASSFFSEASFNAWPLLKGQTYLSKAACESCRFVQVCVTFKPVVKG